MTIQCGDDGQVGIIMCNSINAMLLYACPTQKHFSKD